MGDQTPASNSTVDGTPADTGIAAAAAEPVRTRWAPKPEQILVLEAIFNSGMVNPTKDETVGIRKHLEKFGPVGDANVFYWFQNRRSRSRRRQRQMQASMAGDPRKVSAGIPGTGGATPYEAASPSISTTSSSNSSPGGFVSSSATAATSPSSSYITDNSAKDIFSISRQMGFPDSTINQAPIYSPALPPPHGTASNLYYHSGECMEKY